MTDVQTENDSDVEISIFGLACSLREGLSNAREALGEDATIVDEDQRRDADGLLGRFVDHARRLARGGADQQ